MLRNRPREEHRAVSFNRIEPDVHGSTGKSVAGEQPGRGRHKGVRALQVRRRNDDGRASTGVRKLADALESNLGRC